jgi:hypothetical protein
VSRTTVKWSFPPDVVAILAQSRDEKQAAAFWKIEPLKIVGKTIRLFAARSSVDSWGAALNLLIRRFEENFSCVLVRKRLSLNQGFG